MAEKKVRKYVLYALGEIFLVVVGILIALWINSINTTQKYEANEQQLLKDVTAQLIKDKADLLAFKEQVKARNRSFSYFSKQNNGEDSLGKIPFPLLYGLDLSKLNIDPVVVSTIENFDFKRSEVSLKCTQILTDYKYAQKNIAQLEGDMQNLHSEFTTYLGENYTWYIDYSFDNHIVAEATEYFLKDIEYKKFIARMNTISSKRYKIELEQFEEKIKNHIDTLMQMN